MAYYRNDVADVAYAAALTHKQGKRVYKPYADAETMNLVEKGYCARFVRQCHEAAMHLSPFGWSFAAPTARDMERQLRGAGKATKSPLPGDIVGMNGTSVAAGHIGIYLGYQPELGAGRWIAHNTAGSWGGYGPGTCFTPLSKVAHIVSGWFAVLPSKPDPEKLTVRIEGQEPIDCDPEIEVGVTRVDLRPVVEALGWEIVQLPPTIVLRPKAVT